MNEEMNYIEQEESSSFDYMKILKDLWRNKLLYCIVLPIAFVLAAVYNLGQPDFYTCTVKLSPELGSGSRSSLGLSSLASNFGVNLGANSGTNADAILPELYPDLMNSVDFKTSLFSVKVMRDEDMKTFTYYDYLMNEQKKPWWSNLFGSGEKKKHNLSAVNPFRLNAEQTAIAARINQNVVCDVDKKTMVITINVTDQDPLICATMADSVKMRLQNFITDYRTSKVRVDLAYNQKLYKEAKARYEKARQRYAEFSDANQDVVLKSIETKLTDLENEMQLQYNIYQQVVSQLQQAEMKVQQETPAFTTLQSATVPVGPAGPKRSQMCLIFVVFAFLLTTAWILYKEGSLKQLLGM